ncbi:hypothetical protein [Microbulbifer epialgicus]|uniref:Uncharacterized protein n=1 Tax=Microbulbifer epialgicus TaxID=393907 RepID=A0ABV4P6N3_9GAMM
MKQGYIEPQIKDYLESDAGRALLDELLRQRLDCFIKFFTEQDQLLISSKGKAPQEV